MEGNTTAVSEKEGASGSEKKNRPFRRRSPRKIKRKSSRASSKPENTAPMETETDWDISEFKVPPMKDKIRFHDFDLPSSLLHAISDLGFQYCTPIQAEILPSTLSGKDASGRAQTGTGKTAAFLITIITRMLNNPILESRNPGTPRTLIIAPTRELVLQISEEARELARYSGHKIISVFGGMDYQKQRQQLNAGPVDIIVATPGRLLDFQRQHDIALNKVEVLILDEADRMLDMGFIPDVRKIIHSTPRKDNRQTLLFSATLTGAITRLAAQWTRDPITVEIKPEQVAVDTVEQIVYNVTTADKLALLLNIILRKKLERVLVFCNRRDEVRQLSDTLIRYGINSSVLSGEVPQKKRLQRLKEFKAGKICVLVATDVAGRGIHIEGMDHVINYKLPHDPEDYVHRIGRTGRAGAAGTSISFADERDAFFLPAIEEFMDRKLPCIEPEQDWLVRPARIAAKERPGPPKKKKASPRQKRIPRQEK